MIEKIFISFIVGLFTAIVFIFTLFLVEFYLFITFKLWNQILDAESPLQKLGFVFLFIFVEAILGVFVIAAFYFLVLNPNNSKEDLSSINFIAAYIGFLVGILSAKEKIKDHLSDNPLF